MAEPELLALAAELVDIGSVSHHERAIADRIEHELRAVPHLQVDRVGDNVVARTQLGRASRLVLAGHTDTVPANGNERAVIDGDRLSGLGACDMKGTLAVMLELARGVTDPAVDVSYVFYACEEVASHHSGLGQLFDEAPELVAGDAAVLGEPTGGVVEAGCQGTLRLQVAMTGERAHTARAWMGTNAIHRLGEVLAILDRYEARRPVIDSCEFREALQAVFVEGGAAGNVVPDHALVVVNHRFAPDRTVAEAEAHVRDVLAPALDERDRVELVDQASAAAPGLDHPLLRALVAGAGGSVRAKLGWTDVARFAEAGIPATNFGAGDPEIAHTAGEWVERADLALVHDTLGRLLTTAS
jgi:succinyl-diaminopimelate desuccinylase